MKKPWKWSILAFLFIIPILLAACTANADGAANAVQNYLQALIDQDRERLSNLSCAAWEADALTELESFTAVSVSLQDMSCQEEGADGEATLVACSGKIVANYGNEVLEIDLSERTYQTVYEGGEWRMCGYP